MPTELERLVEDAIEMQRRPTPPVGLETLQLEIAKLDWEVHHGVDVDLSDIYEVNGP